FLPRPAQAPLSVLRRRLAGAQSSRAYWSPSRTTNRTRRVAIATHTSCWMVWPSTPSDPWPGCRAGTCSTSKLRPCRIAWLYQRGRLGARSDRTGCDADPSAVTLLVRVRVQSFLLSSIGEHGVCGAAVHQSNV